MYMYTTARILSRHSRESTDCYTSSYRITSNPLVIHEYILIMVMLTLYRCYLENFCPPSVWHCYCYKLLNNLSIIPFWLDASGGTKIFRVSHQKIWSGDLFQQKLWFPDQLFQDQNSSDKADFRPVHFMQGAYNSSLA